jgi:hypothetical protein
LAFLLNDGQVYNTEHLLRKRKVTEGKKCVVAVTSTKVNSGHSRTLKKPETGIVAWVID